MFFLLQWLRNLRLDESSLALHSVDVIAENFRFMVLDFDPDIVHIYKPMTGGCRWGSVFTSSMV